MKLPILKTPEPRKPALDRIFPLPAEERSLAQIDNSLRETMRGVIGGYSVWPLFMSSREPGAGKTCAALCLVDLCPGSIYVTVGGLCGRLNQAQIKGFDYSIEGRGATLWPHDLWKMIATAPLVVLDEIGCRDKVSDAHYDAVKEVIDCRHFKPLIAISNFELARLTDLYDGRIMSRLGAGTVIELAGIDRRLG